MKSKKTDHGNTTPSSKTFRDEVELLFHKSDFMLNRKKIVSKL
jgi:hypothetical protein